MTSGFPLSKTGDTPPASLDPFPRLDGYSESLRISANYCLFDLADGPVEHMVRVRDFKSWLESNGRSPAEMVLKSRLRELLRKWAFQSP
jgi:hypothetical protein